MSNIYQFARSEQRPRTKLVCSKCGAQGEMGCDCGVAYIRARDFAAAAVADPANAGKSNRKLADELGVSYKTIERARQESVGTFVPTESRLGRDRKTYKARKPRTPVLDRAREIVRDRVANAEPVNAHKVGKEHGISHVMIDQAVAAERVANEEQRKREAAVAEAALAAAPLSATAEQKLEAHKRKIERALNAEHDARMRGLDEEVRQRVLNKNAEYRATLEEIRNRASHSEFYYNEMAHKFKPLFTPEQFMTVWRCLHPDSRRSVSDGVLAEAFALFDARRLQLTGQR
jgi:hypothetical protein